MNLNEIRFKAIQTVAVGEKACKRCMFHELDNRSCFSACHIATSKGMPDCDDDAPPGKSYVYVLDETDPRQLTLLDKEH